MCFRVIKNSVWKQVIFKLFTIKVRSLKFLMENKRIPFLQRAKYSLNKIKLLKKKIKENSFCLNFFKMYSFSLFLNKILFILPLKSLYLFYICHTTNTITVWSLRPPVILFKFTHSRGHRWCLLLRLISFACDYDCCLSENTVTHLTSNDILPNAIQ